MPGGGTNSYPTQRFKAVVLQIPLSRERKASFNWSLSISLLASAATQSAFGSDDCDVGGTRGVLGVRQLERASTRINSEAFNAVSVLARHKQVLATWVQREVTGIGVSHKRMSTGKPQHTIGRVHGEHSDTLVDPTDIVIV